MEKTPGSVSETPNQDVGNINRKNQSVQEPG